MGAFGPARATLLARPADRIQDLVVPSVSRDDVWAGCVALGPDPALRVGSELEQQLCHREIAAEHRHVEGTHLSSAEIDDFRAPREEEARGLSIASFDRFMELRRGDTIDRGLELWPALESIRARDNEPRIVQGEALWCGGAMVGRDFGHCVRRQRPIRVEQFLGLTLQLLKIGVLSRIRRVGGF